MSKKLSVDNLVVLFVRTLLAFLHLQALVGTTNSTDTIGQSCPNFSPFIWWIRRQCPPMTDERCVIGLPCDEPIPIGQLHCATADELPSPHLKLLSAREMLNLVKYRDPAGRPWCLLSLFFSPDCVFSAKVANSLHQIAPIYPKLRVIAVDVSQTGKDTESLISQYGIASTPVIALWQDGIPRYRLYDDYSKLENLVRVIRIQTDLRPKDRPRSQSAEELEQTETDEGGTGLEPGRHQFLSRFKYLQEELGFDWYLFLAILACVANLAYFALSSRKGRAFLEQHFPGLFGIIIL